MKSWILMSSALALVACEGKNSGTRTAIASVVHAAAAADNVIAGHGLTLVRRLTARLSYGNRGSEVIALIGRDRTTNQSIPLLVSEGSESGA